MNHSFNVEIAELYGVEKAILIENIAFWIKKNIANKTHSHNGYTWTYNSAVAYEKMFPYLKARSISRWLLELEKIGILKTGNFHQDTFRKSKWFTIIDTEILLTYSISQFGESISQSGVTNGQSGESSGQKLSMLTDINTDQDEEEEEGNYPSLKEKQNYTRMLQSALPFTDTGTINGFIDKHGKISLLHYVDVWKKNLPDNDKKANAGLLYKLLSTNDRYISF